MKQAELRVPTWIDAISVVTFENIVAIAGKYVKKRRF